MRLVPFTDPAPLKAVVVEDVNDPASVNISEANLDLNKSHVSDKKLSEMSQYHSESNDIRSTTRTQKAISKQTIKRP